MMLKRRGIRSVRRLQIAMRGCLPAMRPALLMVLLLTALAAVSPPPAFGQTRTTVADTIHAPDGSLPSGQIVISANSTFTAADGTVVFRGTVAAATVTNGSFSVALIPNAGSTPSGTSYSAIYKLAGVPYRNETWVVPSSANPAALADVRSAMLSGPSQIVSASQMPAVISSSAIVDKGGQFFNVKAYGAKGDGLTDDTAAVNAAITAAYNAGGGIIYFPPGRYLIAGQIVLPNDNTAVNPSIPYSRQPYFRFTGGGHVENGESQIPGTSYGTAALDLTYSGSNAKILTLGLGTIEIDHLTLFDSGTDSTPFFLTTGTTPKIHNVSIIGTGDTQDALILGGTETGTGQTLNDPNAEFQGYMPVIRDNYFNYVRRCIYGRTDVSGGYFAGNFDGPGTASNLTDGAPFELDGHWKGTTTSGNTFIGNRCQLTNYYYCYKLTSSQNNFIQAADVEDVQNNATSVVWMDAASTYNLVLISQAPSGGSMTYLTHVTDLSGTATVIDSTQSATNTLGSGGLFTLNKTFQVDTSGNQILQQSIAATSGQNQSSPNFYLGGNYWDGTQSQKDQWDLYDFLAAGTNPTNTLYFSHSGSSGQAIVELGGPSGNNEVQFGGGSYVSPTGSAIFQGSLSINADEYVQNNGNLWIRNQTAATSGSNQSSDYSYLAGNYWNGSGSALDYWRTQDSLGGGTNPPSTLKFVHVGSSGPLNVLFPGAVQSSAVAFASMPACNSGNEGSIQAITDSTVNTWGSTIAGGGSNHVLGYCDGTNWTVAAK